MNSQRSRTIAKLRNQGLPFTIDEEIDKSKILSPTRLIDNGRTAIIFQLNFVPLPVIIDSDEDIEALINDSDIFIPEAVKVSVPKT